VTTAAPLPRLRNFVGGESVETKDGLTSDVVDPATREVYAQAPLSGPADVDAAMAVAAAVWINTRIPFVPEMPHGGFGHSGHGKDLSIYGFEEYTRLKHVMSYIGASGG
jgi:acyl-CoA reductase-like NAD-dependent aldehyde dehydrogenase